MAFEFAVKNIRLVMPHSFSIEINYAKVVQTYGPIIQQFILADTSRSNHHKNKSESFMCNIAYCDGPDKSVNPKMMMI